MRQMAVATVDEVIGRESVIWAFGPDIEPVVEVEAGAVVRFEIYPRMDSLVEVEGPPTAIESAIATLGLPREGFTAERLPAFVSRFEMRTGERAALSEAELRGEYQFRRED